MTRYFEDYSIGGKFISPGRTVTEADISICTGIARISEPLFMDEEYAKTTNFGTRIAPGRLTVLLMGGLTLLAGLWDLENMIALVGLNIVGFHNPVKAGDTIKVECEIIDKKETSKAERGLITHRETCRNQRGQVIAIIETTHLVKRKTAGR